MNKNRDTTPEASSLIKEIFIRTCTFVYSCPIRPNHLSSDKRNPSVPFPVSSSPSSLSDGNDNRAALVLAYLDRSELAYMVLTDPAKSPTLLNHKQFLSSSLKSLMYSLSLRSHSSFSTLCTPATFSSLQQGMRRKSLVLKTHSSGRWWVE